jgi:hypothetical protein
MEWQGREIGAVTFGLKVARVAEASIAGKSKYTYRDGKAWAATHPAVNDASINILNYKAGNVGVATGVNSPPSLKASVLVTDVNLIEHPLVQIFRHLARSLQRRSCAGQNF